MVTKTEIVQAVGRVRRQARVLSPDLELLCQVAETVVAKASYEILPPAKQEDTAAKTTGPTRLRLKPKRDRASYMRDYRAGKRRRDGQTMNIQGTGEGETCSKSMSDRVVIG